MTDIESFILKQLVQNEEYSRATIPYIKRDYFSDDLYSKVFDQIYSHFDEFNTLPTKEALSIDVSNKVSLFEKQYERAEELVDSIYQGVDEESKTKQNTDWAVSRTEEWCKQQAMYNAIVESADIIDPTNKSMKKKPYTAIESIVRDALSVSFDKHVGHDYFDDAESRYQFYHSKEERIPFDIDSFNEITAGGLPRKTLNLILAGVHVGKTAFMCHYAASCVKAGRRVLYITCEMAEEKIAERIDANVMGVNIGDLCELSKDMYTGKISRAKSKYTGGCLKIKEYPTGTANVSHFRALMNELAIKQDFVPEVVIIDYLNICSSMRYSGDVSNSYGYVKTIAEEIRGMAIEYNIPVLSSAQVNRSSFSNSDYDMDGVAESFGISATADFMFALIKTEALEKHGLLCVKQLKNRYEDMGNKKRFVVAVNKPKMTFSEADPAAQKMLSTGSAGVAAISGSTAVAPGWATVTSSLSASDTAVSDVFSTDYDDGLKI